MSLFHVHSRRLKSGAAALGGAAAIAMTLIGVASGSAHDAHVSMGPQPPAMTAGATATATSPELTVLAKAAPVVKAPPYGR